MEHENIDETTRYLTACENVKKIVNAIKSIKIKYYPNFARISAEDKKIYEQLEANLEKISEENNLNGLKVALMEEVSAKYDKKDIKSEQGNPNSVDNRLQACYGAVDSQKEALSRGKIKQAKKCQEVLKQYLDEIDSMSSRELVINYKREKFGELIRDREAVQKKNEASMRYMKGCCLPEDVRERQHAKEQIEEARNNSVMLFDIPKVNTKESKMNSDELLIG